MKEKRRKIVNLECECKVKGNVDYKSNKFKRIFGLQSFSVYNYLELFGFFYDSFEKV